MANRTNHVTMAPNVDSPARRIIDDDIELSQNISLIELEDVPHPASTADQRMMTPLSEGEVI